MRSFRGVSLAAMRAASRFVSELMECRVSDVAGSFGISAYPVRSTVRLVVDWTSEELHDIILRSASCRVDEVYVPEHVGCAQPSRNI